jgi:hypothetical protein
MVIFRSPEGKPGYHQSEGLEEAMRFAEMLRNQEQVTDARIFRMDEVAIEFKLYYRVEMAAESADPSPPSAGKRAPGGDTAVETATASAPDPAPEAAQEGEPDGDGVATGEQPAFGPGEPEPADPEPADPEPADPEPAAAGGRGSSRHGLFSRS